MFRRIFDFFSKYIPTSRKIKDESEQLPTRTIFFHEDDYCQIEILPFQNYNYCKTEIDRINNFSEEHKAENGIGWTDIYVRQENPISIQNLGISVDSLCSILDEVSIKYDIVNTGYSSYREICQHTMAYGKMKML